MTATAEVRTVAAGELNQYADGIRDVYARAFAAPPWNEDPAQAGSYAERLARDALRPGFTAAVATAGGTVAGFATAWITPEVFPADRSYGQVAEALGPGRAREWLCGALEVNELAVAPEAHGGGLGTALLHAVTGPAPDGRCWLLTSVRAGAALRLYERAGWQRVDAPVPGAAALVVLLGPRHPQRAAAGDR
ncbi:GNAT family N-acetyltransferase [Streptomyces sp. CA-278952]|uniref:GNAT family N-acetyltransferase n=1 Tax=unclassified Streptomyces TaxID=2593676 RepID=UPI002241D786|nr:MULTISPECIES: GNAT family N-acetyltransferase [unclassified Streptomyces]UZI31180.1 GNAT family N-acetyltransferase [Streptomyces sp. VB1]WDG31225.1 GNAT family N-acetyltransferase [Streptomyces sp. CA-278952]